MLQMFSWTIVAFGEDQVLWLWFGLHAVQLQESGLWDVAVWPHDYSFDWHWLSWELEESPIQQELPGKNRNGLTRSRFYACIFTLPELHKNEILLIHPHL
jgi:hypothetical protein